MELYSKQHLLKALEEAGLPHTYKSLLKYEKMGVLPGSNNAIGMGVTNRWRLYTKPEIESAVLKLKEYKDKGLLENE